MLAINSYIIYGANGVCKVSDIRKEKLCGTKKTYYILNPVSSDGATIYVPVENEELMSKMKKLLNREELISLVLQLKDSDIDWISDNKERNENYNRIFENGDRKEILHLIRTIYIKRKELVENNKKLWAIDENALKRAEKMINEEFSLVLSILPDQVPEFIENTLA